MKERIKKDKKNVLITGVNGHLGSRLLDEFIGKRYNIFTLDREKQKENKKNVKYLIVDITDKKKLYKYKKLFNKIDILIHLAAYVPLENKLDDLEKSIDINIKGSINLLNLLKKKSKYIFANTCEIYNPKTFYAISKLTAEKYLEVLCKKKNITFISLRFASIYGPGEKIRRAIPNFIKLAIKNKDIIIFGDGKEKRTYVYIEDAIQGIIKAVNYVKSGVFNISSEEIITIFNLTKLIKKITKSKSRIIFKARKKEKIDLVFDIKKTKKLLHFKPRFKLKKGLIKETEYFLKHG